MMDDDVVNERIVVLIDMDCFYCQVEEGLDPTLRHKPAAVVQYNQWKGGGIIAVNYAARACGVTRHMRGDEARARCPDLRLCRVPVVRGRADISKYRAAGERVAEVLTRYTPLMERASIDEAYLDVTAQASELSGSVELGGSAVAACEADTRALGYASWSGLVEAAALEPHVRRLVAAAVLVRDIRAAVRRDTGYECSAGIAHNKMLAKAICGMNKPNKQTVLSAHALDAAAPLLPLRSLRGLGGRRGRLLCAALGGDTLADLRAAAAAAPHLLRRERDGARLLAVASGEDAEPVRAKLRARSVGCCKQFRGAAALSSGAALRRWLGDLVTDLHERLATGQRTPRRMVVSVSTAEGSASRSCALPPAPAASSPALLLRTARTLLTHALPHVAAAAARPETEDVPLQTPVTFLGLSVGKFDDNTTEDSNVKKIADFFSSRSLNASKENVEAEAVDGKYDVHLTREAERDRTLRSCSLQKKMCLLKSSTQTVPSETLRSSESTARGASGEFVVMDREEASNTLAEDAWPGGSAETCPECGVRVPGAELLTHADYHAALRLQDEELARPPPRPLAGTIERWFPRTDAAAPTERCAECDARVPLARLQLHRDFHAARALSRRLNPARSASVATKRARNVSPDREPKKSRSSILNFFT